MSNSVRFLKKQIRDQMKAHLSSITPTEFSTANFLIQRQFFQLMNTQNAKVIMIYYSINNEVETVGLIRELLTIGKIVTLPICTPAKDLALGVVRTLDELVPGIFGLQEPGPQAQQIEPDVLDLIIVPGIGFDERGYRLGHGMGYYDHFLAKVSSVYKLGLAYDFQLIKELPVEPHDIPINGLLTPTKFLEFSTP